MSLKKIYLISSVHLYPVIDNSSISQSYTYRVSSVAVVSFDEQSFDFLVAHPAQVQPQDLLGPRPVDESPSDSQPRLGHCLPGVVRGSLDKAAVEFLLEVPLDLLPSDSRLFQSHSPRELADLLLAQNQLFHSDRLHLL